jgi:hypothetical protein
MESNKLIAEFMGVKPTMESPDVYSYNDGVFFMVREDNPEKVMEAIAKYAKYHTSWDWLMPVVEKIEDIETIDVDILTNGTKIYEWRSGGEVIVNNCAEISFTNKIEHTYSAVVEFIKWYNEKY